MTTKYILYISSIILWLSNFTICNYFYHDDVSNWWNLKMAIYNICIVLILFALRYKESIKFKLIINIGIGFILSSVIDRIFFGITDFLNKDYLMIVLTIVFSVYDYNKEKYGK